MLGRDDNAGGPSGLFSDGFRCGSGKSVCGNESYDGDCKESEHLIPLEIDLTPVHLDRAMAVPYCGRKPLLSFEIHLKLRLQGGEMILSILFATMVFAQSPTATPLPKSLKELFKDNCLIETTTKYKTGEVKKDTHPYQMKNKAACEKSRKTHLVNFAPDAVEKIESKMVWRGGK